MQMTDSEIFRDYKLSKNKQKQIGILAELNDCSTKEIKEAIAREGEKQLIKEDGKEVEKLLKNIKDRRATARPKATTTQENKAGSSYQKTESNEDKPNKMPETVKEALNNERARLMGYVGSLKLEIQKANSQIEEITAFMKSY